jgi:hypothetical protein
MTALAAFSSKCPYYGGTVYHVLGVPWWTMLIEDKSMSSVCQANFVHCNAGRVGGVGVVVVDFGEQF